MYRFVSITGFGKIFNLDIAFGYIEFFKFQNPSVGDGISIHINRVIYRCHNTAIPGYTRVIGITTIDNNIKYHMATMITICPCFTNSIFISTWITIWMINVILV